ncbi:retrovirus-related pol polyprotein from transposon TNT 1-94 [Tanacetum coccineum]|uniref:Retrovirus-related pol polyprotein from transposon TNT 1-94 n=1 Tax=Tanacetum coccineum TaxID=301880 RepID=A0ABQ4X6J7_9ASTR
MTIRLDSLGIRGQIHVAGGLEKLSGQVVQQSGIQCFNCKEFGHFAKECSKPKWVKDSTYHKEKMLLCKQDEKVTWQDTELALQNKRTELEEYMAFNNRIVDHEKLEHKLNETLRLLAQKEIDIKEGLKVKAYEISVVKEKHDELVKQSLLTKSHYEGLVKETNKEIVYQAWVKHSNDRLHLCSPTAQDMEILIKTCLMPLAFKTQNDSFAFVHELKQEMHADLKYVESLEDEIDEFESDKAEFFKHV